MRRTISAAQHGNLLWMSGTLGTIVDDEDRDVIPKPGRVGDTITLEDAYLSARQCAINQLARIKLILGTLDRVGRIIKVNGYVNAVLGYN